MTMEDKANAIYSVLVEFAGANERDREVFVSHFPRIHEFHEWRFCGLLGFGGKYYPAQYDLSNGCVGCYAEDKTPEREQIIRNTNEALSKLSV